MRHEITIDGWHPARLNQWDGRHWAVRSKAKAVDRDVIALACRTTGVPVATGKRRVSLGIILGPRQRGGDPDAYWKSLLDALKHAGSILDDRKECLELGPVTYSRGPRKATVITLEDC